MGLATHYVPSARLAALEDRLVELDTHDLWAINAAIEEFVGEPDGKPFSLSHLRADIDRYATT